ncbi:MAG: 2-isopropylmalate synthase [Treponemataceae bacterium]|nr:2-isopropylmalate synthase [Spirochaetales bacterium]MDY6031383.1 2-isopropylmalate synthase [Treponemataceae bacterium]
MSKYKAAPRIPNQNRHWPENSITHSPIWCSVDLRDGNQALAIPMSIEQKLEFFDLLVKIGFKQIEVGFPSSSNTEFEFVRRLILENRIPDDVTIQVLCQARKHLVKKTFDAIEGAKNVIFHIYNSTSPSQRKYTFGMSKEQVIEIALDGIDCIKQCIQEHKFSLPNIQLEYSPESFSMTEIDYAVEICNAVGSRWGWNPDNKIIFNLPATVECYTPNVYADAIEYFSNHILHRDCVIISSHCHNDRGTATASCELSLMAGSERVEGCLFGNGERTGNLDIVNLALNMFSDGVDSGLDFSHLNYIAQKYTKLTGLEIPLRQPYVGDLVFTAFSGSHQDAIRKALKQRSKLPEDSVWDVPYLIIDPRDIGREYKEIIRINSQSGKGGAAWILEQDFGYFLPKAMHPVLGKLVTEQADFLQRELSPSEIYSLFDSTWINQVSFRKLEILDFVETHVDGSESSSNVLCRSVVRIGDKKYAIGSKGNGPLDAFVASLKNNRIVEPFTISAFHEHSVGSGSDSDAVAYIELSFENGRKSWGVGLSSNVARAGVNAVVSAINFSNGCYGGK